MKWKVEPAPTSLSTQILPPISSARCLLIVKPRPVPPNLRVVDASAWEKDSKMRSIRSGGMPTPVSETEIRSSWKVEVVGRVLPVSWQAGPDAASEAARQVGAQLVVGLGVAMQRGRVEVETVAVCQSDAKPDVDGVCDGGLEGPAEVRATLDCERLADALGAELSRDAGRYVCNAWLYRVTRALDVPVGFVHVPASGMTAERLLRGLASLC